MHAKRLLSFAAAFLALGSEAGPSSFLSLPRVRVNRYKPHQSHRECVRRRGGQEWLNFRAADRISRGLPVRWPYQPMQS